MLPLEALEETKRITVIENSKKGSCHKQFGKRKNKVVLQPGDEARICSRDNLKDKYKKGRFIQ